MCSLGGTVSSVGGMSFPSNQPSSITQPHGLIVFVLIFCLFHYFAQQNAPKGWEQEAC